MSCSKGHAPQTPHEAAANLKTCRRSYLECHRGPIPFCRSVPPQGARDFLQVRCTALWECLRWQEIPMERSCPLLVSKRKLVDVLKNAPACSRTRMYSGVPHTHTDTHTHTHTHTHRHTDTQTHRHTDTQTHRHTDTQTHRHTDTQTHRHTDTQTITSRLWTRSRHITMQRTFGSHRSQFQSVDAGNAGRRNAGGRQSYTEFAAPRQHTPQASPGRAGGKLKLCADAPEPMLRRATE